MDKLLHDVLCPQNEDEDGCPCARWIRQGGNVAFNPVTDCDRCSCFCDFIAKARADERERWLDFSGQQWGSHDENCEWWGRDSAYMKHCEDFWAATWVACACEKGDW